MSTIRIRIDKNSYTELLDVRLEADETVAERAVAEIMTLLALAMNTQEVKDESI